MLDKLLELPIHFNIMSTPYITKIELPDQSGRECEIIISGNWPNPSWRHTETIIDFNDIERTVSIKYLGKSKGGIAMQMLKSFSDTIKIKFPSSGEWRLLINGRSNIREYNVFIK